MKDEIKQSIIQYILKPFRYYASGRMLFVSGVHDIALINIGYAMDLMLKWCLTLQGDNFDNRKHNLLKMVELLESDGSILLYVPKDLIYFLDSNLNSR